MGNKVLSLDRQEKFSFIRTENEWRFSADEPSGTVRMRYET